MAEVVPRYLTIEQSLRARIAALEPHAPLLSDAQLCREFGVSRMTARGAVQLLVQEGLVYRVPGRGTFVAAAPARRTASRVLSFTDEMRRPGRAPRSRVVERRVRVATQQTAVFPCERVHAVLEADLEVESLFETLVEAGLVPTVGRAVISAEAATAEDSRLLGVRRGASLLVERGLIKDQHDAPLELTESRYVPARYDIDVDLEVEVPTVEVTG